MDFQLQVVTVPVTDADRALSFYRDRLGFAVDIDMAQDGGARIVQLTPPGSTCSIHLGTTATRMEPGSVDNLYLIVRDVRAAKEELSGRGAEVGEVMVFEGGGFREATADEPLDYVGFLFVEDPDGNAWNVQQVPAGG